ncbi:S46 family peptidase [Porphyromonas gingivalis]|uniref:S46 family peptidase n=1 Tax=Porphyromonas gingivalis TaxID=837 RepID=UPI001F2960E5|nr:S46 family peptidase [Porphyromonas gingivalis]MCE8183090.1 S46 family peptidase [Porphyromonas gingivalis]
MKKRLLLPLFAALCLSQIAHADEGMWLMQQLGRKYAQMKERGLKMKEYDLYNPNGTSLKDAVVLFDGGCTGEVVSDRGLVLTNHHCGYDMIQAHSTLEHNYLEDGFWAMSEADELPNKDISVVFIDKIEDVTDYVKKELKAIKDPNSMDYLSPKYLQKLADKKAGKNFSAKNPGLSVEIKAFYGGNLYLMFTKKTYTDVRLVGAPPSSIGKFGADTDNWIWPRHTGDFSIFRIYADKNGNPAPYSEDNVPLRPKRFFNISLGGVQENDYAMIMGFPGTTHRYFTASEVDEWKSIDNDIRIRMRDIRQGVMLREMLADPQIKIMYSAKYAASQNAYKRAIGANWAIKTRGLRQNKQAMQDRLIAWGAKQGIPRYEEAVHEIDATVAKRADLRRRYWMIEEGIIRGIEFARSPIPTEDETKALQGNDASARKEAIDKIHTRYSKFANKDYSAEVDKKVAVAMLTEYLKEIPYENLPLHLRLVKDHFAGDVQAYVDDIFARSVFGSEAQFDAFAAVPSVEKLAEDPMVLFASSVFDEYRKLYNELRPYDDPILRAQRTYIAGLLEMDGDQDQFPDANLTLRFTYGQVKGYSPRDNVYYGHQTTLDGVMEKEDPDNWEFVVDPKLKAVYERKDFGRYADRNGRMPVAFCATTHTTGGNSGSPVMNANGELIGLNFDRNWEGVGGDIQYLADYQRSIIVDIRYVLLVIDKVGGCQRLLDEMNIVP